MPGSSLQRAGLSRRQFLWLTGVTLLAGCQTAQPSPPVPTATPRLVLQRITLENANRIRQVSKLDLSQGAVRGVAWSPDSRLLAMAPYNQVQVWEIETMKRLATLQGHQYQINGMAWSPDGRLLASVSDDGTLRLWDPTIWKSHAVLQGLAADVVLSVAWSPDSRRLVTGNQDGTVQVWDAHTLQRLGRWTRPSMVKAAGSQLAVWGVAWSPDGQRIASNRYDVHVFLWDARTGRLVATLLPSAQPNGVAWSPAGRVLATTSDDGTVQLWNQANTNYRVLQGHADAGWAYPVMWSPDGKLLAATRQSGLVQVWESETSKELAALQGHTQAVWSAAWSPDGLLIASGSDDETVRLWGVV
ncbi:MAG TPA: WD40 repeat domain-containing protein [Ktedonobacteraceae bacterium]|nr:WD40 repeat domain-containing protein [Ktedonobacteraceae bacterium]